MEKILIIDDSKANRLVLSNILSEKYSVETAEDGNTGIEIAKSFNPDLILLDIVMPIRDGYSVCEELKKDDICKKIPVIFLTSKDDTDDIIKAYEIGGADYILKPYNFLELDLRIKTQINFKKNCEEINNMKAERMNLISKIEEMQSDNSEKRNKLNSIEEKLACLEELNQNMFNEIKKLC